MTSAPFYDIIELQSKYWPIGFTSLIHIKLWISIISNYKRKSTIGWNIHNILLDFTGGAFSFGQNIIDSIRDKFSITTKGQSKGLNMYVYDFTSLSKNRQEIMSNIVYEYQEKLNDKL